VPLFLATHACAPRQAFWLGYSWGIVALGGVLWWLTAFGLPVWVMAAGLFAVFPAVTMAGIAWMERGRRGTVVLLGVPILWTAVEFLRSQGPLGFPWALLGESQHRALAVSQVASVAGVYGVTYLVVLVNAALYLLLTRRTTILSIALAGAAIVGVIAWGSHMLRLPLPVTMTAAVVQPDYVTRSRWHASPPGRDLALLEQLTAEAAARGATLVVWPETASPTDVLGDRATFEAVRTWARRDRISLIASSLEGGRTNSAFSFAPSGMFLGRYDKVRLVPFAEFGEKAGRVPNPLPVPQGAVGVMICFESTFPDLARREVTLGAGLLAVITNDAWFGGSSPPVQHAALASFRAIEEGRYLLRAANSGWSQIIDPRGRVLAELRPGERGTVSAGVAPLGGLTPYARLGDVFGWGAVFAGAVLLRPSGTRVASSGATTRELVRLLVVSIVPLAALLGGLRAASMFDLRSIPVGGAFLPLPILAVLAATVTLSPGRSARDLGFQVAGFVPAAAAGLAAVGALAGVALFAFSAQGSTPALPPPAGGWWSGSAVQVLVVGLGLEWWLRGLVFAAAQEWRGWKLAVLWASVLGGVAGLPLGAEAIVWGICSGLLFGLIRARWAQIPALALAHGAGGILLAFLIPPW